MPEVRKLQEEYLALLEIRKDWEADWRSLSNYLLPGRGINWTYDKPRRRKLTSTNIINTTGTDALDVMAAMLQGGLTSAARNWFKLQFTNKQIQSIDPLSRWLYEAERTLMQVFSNSNFYSSIFTFYREYGGFGTSSLMVMEDDRTHITFIPLTVGEYAFALDAQDRVDKFYRAMWMTPKTMLQKFGRQVLPESITQLIDNDQEENNYFQVIQAILKEKYRDKGITSVYFINQGSARYNAQSTGFPPRPLKVSGFYEFPAIVARMDVIGNDEYGLGAGHRALPNIKRLQEMEKSFLMATHKAVDPPVMAPTKLKGKLDMLPGGKNYYADPNLPVKSLFENPLDFQGVMAAIERVESRIKTNFFNDLLLTTTRDPDASPLRTGEVEEKSDERLIRMGPVIQRLQSEAFEPIIERAFNILLRKGVIPPLPPELASQAGDYEVRMISPLAQSQKLLEARSIQSFLTFIGGMAQFKPEVLDKIEGDATVDEYADITGVPDVILTSDEEVQRIRDARLIAQREQQQREAQLQNQQMTNETQKARAEVAKTLSEAGANANEVLGPIQ